MARIVYSHSLRVRKARLGHAVGSTGARIGLAAMIILALAGLWLIFNDSLRLSELAFGWALLLGVGLLWYYWDLAEPTPGPIDLSKATIALDQIVSADIVDQIREPMPATELWQVLSQHWQVRFILIRFGLDVREVNNLISQLPDTEPVWQSALNLSQQLSLNELDAATIFVPMLLAAPGTEQYLRSLRLEPIDIIEGLFWLERLVWLDRRSLEPSQFGGIARDWASGYTPTLERYGRNISIDIQRGGQSYDVLSHLAQVEQLALNLSRPAQNSVALIGELGTGKSSIVHALAETLIKGDNVGRLAYHQIVSLDAATILSANQQPGYLEQILLQIFGEAIRAGNIILFLDDAQIFFSQGVGAIDLSKILLPILQQSGLRLIIASDPVTWQRLTAANHSLGSIFNVVQVPEPDQMTVMRILEERAPIIEHRTGGIFTYQSLQEIYRLSERYLTTQAFPGKAIKLLADSAGYADDRQLITPESVQACVEQMSGVKLAAADSDESDRLLNLEAILHQRMINQTQAVTAVAGALRRTRAGVSNPHRPVGSFLFLGPTGVGKTELARSLAGAYFGGRNEMIRLDMSEYQRPEDVGRLLGAASGDHASPLLMAIRQRPFRVVLLDEVEKAHPDILNVLLQLLDEGSITDDSGQAVSFKDSIIIATSNAGADEIRRRIDAGASIDDFEDEFVNHLIDSHQFRPELLNRFDEVVLFRPLNKAELLQVVGLMLAEVNQTLARQKISVSLTEAAANYIVEQGFDPRLGARPMRRMMQRSVENKVASSILSGEVHSGDSVRLDAADLAEQASR